MKTRRSTITALSLFLLALFATATMGYTGSEVMLQGFNWESHNYDWYNTVASKASDLQACKIDMVWLPPPSDAGSDQGYLPRQLYIVNSRYGTQAQLQNCITTLHGAGVKAIADIVINHRVGTYDWADFSNPTWGTWAVCGDDEWTGATGNNDSGDGYSAARDLDHSNNTVQSDITAWMNWLKNTIGFDGWRYDYVKGYWGGYNKIYNNGTSPFFSVGEYWPDITGDYYASGSACDYHRQILADWITATGSTSTAFDFTTKWQLQLALERNELWRMGSIPGLIGWWGARAVTFLDNHDTGSTQAHWPFPGAKVMQGYAYILTHPGIPCVFWDHFYDWGHHDAIKALILIRKNQGLTSTSSVSVQASSANLYAAVIDNKVAMKIGSGIWNPGSGWTLAASGTDYAVWTVASGSPPAAPVGVSATATSSSSITVSWNAVNGATSYTVYRATSAGGTYTSVGSSSGTSKSVTGLSAGTTCYFKVKAVNSYGSSTFSSYASATTQSGGSGTLRTVVFMYKETTPGQDIFIKGGHDAGLVPSVYPSMSEPITYNNTLNTTTAAIKAADASLDWGSESALDWTCDSWPASWGTVKTYANDGYGQDPENQWGLHWWKFDVTMLSGNPGDWFEFKAFMREGSTEWWESDRNQSGTPHNTINHWGKKGYITRCSYDEDWVEFTPL